MAFATSVSDEISRSMSRHNPVFPRLMIYIFAAAMGLGAFAQSQAACPFDEQDPLQKETTELVWRSGDRLPGRPIGLKDRKLVFESSLFREPLEIGVAWLKSFELKKPGKPTASDETFAIQLIDGQVFLADIKKLDEDVLTIESQRAGTVEIDRSRIASIINQTVSQTLVSGTVDLEQWDAKRGDKQYWKAGNNGEVLATRDDIHLFLESDLPDSCLIDFEVAWDEKLDFAIALEIPYGARSLGSVPRLESWDGSIVFYHDDDFEIVMADLDENVKSLKLLVHWNRKTNQVVIHDEKGAELASAEIKKLGKKAQPGIFLQNKNGDMRIKSFGIRSAVAGFDPSKTSIQLKSDDAINSTMESFDGTNWVATDDSGESVEIPADDMVGAFRFNPDSRHEAVTGDTLRFHDGEKVIGEIVAISKDSVTMNSAASPKPIVLKTDRLRQILFDPDNKPDSKETFNHLLISDVGKLHGRLESGSPTDGNVLFWRVAGASESVPFASSLMGEKGERGDDRVNAKVLMQRAEDSGLTDNQWPDTLFLNNRDLLPVRFRSATESEIVVDSFFENRILAGSEVRAVEFGSRGQVDKISFENPGWVKSKAKLSDGKFKLRKSGSIGHPNLMARGGFEFEVNWPNDKYGILNVEFGKSIDGKGRVEKRSSLSFAIMLYGTQYYVTADGNAQNPGQVSNKGSGPVKIRVTVEKNRLIVYAKGKKRLSKKLVSGFGRSVSMHLSDMWNQSISCTLSNLELDDGFLSGEFIDTERKDLILTIPRLKARNPPGQILCATNFDLARGNIVSVDDEHVMFKTDNSVNRYSRDILGSIIWIDTESLIASLAADEIGESPDDPEKQEKKETPDEKQSAVASATNGQVAQVLMRGGRRVTLTLDRWADDTLIGNSELLGACEIPFEQIYEIRMGKFATEAKDVPWSDWNAKLAPKPKLAGAVGAGQDDSTAFGSDSPLIGKTRELAFEMLDGKNVTLESLKGKVVVLDFWATWCGPCVKSLPDVKKVIDSYPESSVTLITINQNESKTKIKSFLKTRELDLAVVLDDGEISESFDVQAIPQTVIIDAAGKIRFVKVGVSNDMQKKLRTAIDSLLDAPEESPPAK